MDRLTSMTAVMVFAAVSFTHPAWANDAAFGGHGADPMPLKNDQIEMVSEHIVIKADSKKRAWKVSCDFVFRNTSDEEVELQIGFPFPTHARNDNLTPPRGFKPVKEGDPLVWKFRSWVRGKPAEVTMKDAGKNPKLPGYGYFKVFLWDVKFEPKETVKIKNTYIHGRSDDIAKTSTVDYVLKTGALWKGGKIGRSRIEVHGPPEMLLPDDPGDPHSEFRRVPPGSKAVVRKDGGVSVYWDLKNFRPKQDLYIRFLHRGSIHAFEDFYPDDDQLAKMSKRELRLARNKIAALHGYVFKSKDLQKHFAAQWWYRPKPDVDLVDLRKYDREQMRKIKALEEERE